MMENPGFDAYQEKRRKYWVLIAACCAHECGELSEGQLAWLLDTDRLTARGFYQRWLDREQMSVEGTDRMAYLLHGPVRAG